MLNPDRFGLLPIDDVPAAVLAAFDCGKPELNSFLNNEAKDFQRKRLAFTTVVFHEEIDGPVGYFCLSNDGIPLKLSEQLEVEGDIPLSSFPGSKIGRLAVSSQLQSNGVGRRILELIVGELIEQSKVSAARLLVVDAANEPRVIKFYERFGFNESLWASDQNRNHGGRVRNEPAAIKMWLDVLNFNAASASSD
ncbi:GNAT family N-acetyltransferase [Aquabacterium sp.]|uniref:GNAT family N-acetyltransferase n=1 Tax=Aquabacterium sp. TaxID=1872578 RepID=UPI003B68D9C0